MEYWWKFPVLPVRVQSIVEDAWPTWPSALPWAQLAQLSWSDSPVAVSCARCPPVSVPVHTQRPPGIWLPVSVILIGSSGSVARWLLLLKIFVFRSTRYQGPTSAMRSIALVVRSDSQAFQVPPSWAALAAVVQSASAPSRPLA